ncbi:MAG: sugar ABC transporter permease [Anaerolineae bacterium]|nr:sugar ABC transporter permease [Anaerolineae bacterium]
MANNVLKQGTPPSVAAPVAKRSWLSLGNLRTQEAIIGYLFILPLVLGFLFFQLYPMIQSIQISFTDWDLIGTQKYVGLANYIKALTKDRLVGIAFANTVYLMSGIPIGMALSLLLALAMNQKIKGIAIFRTIYFLPVVSSVVAISVLWRWIFNPDFGLINVLLKYIGVDGPLWLGSAEWAKPALIIVGVWGGLGFNMLLFLAALQGVPKELMEAATIDGANVWQRFRYITWPFITPTAFFIFVTSIIGTFQVFAQIHLMTRASGPNSIGGGPKWATLTVVYYLWLNGFQYYQMGYASAIAWLLGIVMFALTIMQFLVARRWVFYND